MNLNEQLDSVQRLALASAVATILGVSAPAAFASDFETSANVALTSDYVWRGVSQSDEDPAIQGGFDVAHSSGLYVGTWGSNVDFYDADLELDIYAGYSGEAGDFGYDIGVIRYIYPGTSVDLDFNEFYVKGSYMGFSGSINYSNDVFASDETGIYYSLGYEFSPAENVGLAASVGYYDFDSDLGSPDSYMDYKVGVSTELAGIGFDLSYTDTNGDGEDLFGDLADGRVILTISKSM